MPFFIKNHKSVPTYTEAIAMKYGWMWKIPVDDRFGCGYVFDSDYVSDEDAYKEICEVTGETPEIPKIISFEPGYYKSPWNKNTLAVGLSSGFLEPLEATSIWICVISLTLFAEHLAAFSARDEYAVKEYNEHFNKSIKSILNLVYFHYLTPRDDTEFWKNFNTKTKVPESLKELLEKFNHRTPSRNDAYITREFPADSWLYCGGGTKYFSKDVVEKEYCTYNVKPFSEKYENNFKEELNSIVSQCIDHEEFLKYITKNV